MKLKLSDLKKTTDELARNLEIAHGVRTCKVCGHTPEKLYKAVEKMIKQRDEEIIENIEYMKFTPKSCNEAYWYSRGNMLRSQIYFEAIKDILKIIKEKYGNT